MIPFTRLCPTLCLRRTLRLLALLGWTAFGILHITSAAPPQKANKATKPPAHKKALSSASSSRTVPGILHLRTTDLKPGAASWTVQVRLEDGRLLTLHMGQAVHDQLQQALDEEWFDQEDAAKERGAPDKQAHPRPLRPGRNLLLHPYEYPHDPR